MVTKEQIAELRFNASHVLKWPLAERLIAEREALLEALKSAADMLRAACEEDCTAEAVLAEAAIAKAEAP